MDFLMQNAVIDQAGIVQFEQHPDLTNPNLTLKIALVWHYSTKIDFFNILPKDGFFNAKWGNCLGCNCAAWATC